MSLAFPAVSLDAHRPRDSSKEVTTFRGTAKVRLALPKEIFEYLGEDITFLLFFRWPGSSAGPLVARGHLRSLFLFGGYLPPKEKANSYK